MGKLDDLIKTIDGSAGKVTAAILDAANGTSSGAATGTDAGADTGKAGETDLAKAITEIGSRLTGIEKMLSTGEGGKEAGIYASAIGEISEHIDNLGKSVEAVADRLTRLEQNTAVRKSAIETFTETANGSGEQSSERVEKGALTTINKSRDSAMRTLVKAARTPGGGATVVLT